MLPGFREMKLKDVPEVTILLENFLKSFPFRIILNEAEVEHWFLPVQDVMCSYVVEVHHL